MIYLNQSILRFYQTYKNILEKVLVGSEITKIIKLFKKGFD